MTSLVAYSLNLFYFIYSSSQIRYAVIVCIVITKNEIEKESIVGLCFSVYGVCIVATVRVVIPAVSLTGPQNRQVGQMKVPFAS